MWYSDTKTKNFKTYKNYYHENFIKQFLCSIKQISSSKHHYPGKGNFGYRIQPDSGQNLQQRRFLEYPQEKQKRFFKKEFRVEWIYMKEISDENRLKQPVFLCLGRW